MGPAWTPEPDTVPPVGTLTTGAAPAPVAPVKGAVDQGLLDGMPWPAVLLDKRGTIQLANQPWWRRMVQGKATPATCGPGVNYLDVCRASALELPEVGLLADAIERVLSGDQDSYVFDYPITGEGREEWFSAHCTPVGLGPDGALMVHQDITERVQALGALADQASHDGLTGLANRQMFLDRLRQALERGEPCAVLFMDLDDFKLINDTLGHGVGDTLLRGVADRLRHAARPDDVVARLGGDEFTVLMRDIHDEATALAAAERVHEAFTAPFDLAGQRRWVRVSVGCRLAEPDGSPAEEAAASVLRDADVALYQAKGGGKHRVELFSETTRAVLVRRLEIEQELRLAVEEGTLEVRFQPQVQLRTGALVGFEALARWSHPELGVVSATEFVSVAEERGLIIALGALVLDRVCLQLAEWRKTIDPQLSATVNVSAHQLADPGFEQRVLKSVEAAGVDPSALCLEVTESALMSTGDEPIRRLHSLREKGLYVAVDDFGTGWSSLAQLKRLPVDVLKIDRSFVDGLGIDQEDTAIVASILSLASAMGLHVIAEGIETPLQAGELAALGCPVGQGFLFAPAVPASGFPSLVGRGNRIRTPDSWNPTKITRRPFGMLDAMLDAIGVSLGDA